MPFKVPIANLMFKVPVTAGMNPYVLLGMVPLLRNTTQDHEPILVSWLWSDVYRIEDGRHRTIASIIAGRWYVLAELEEGNSGKAKEPVPTQVFTVQESNPERKPAK